METQLDLLEFMGFDDSTIRTFSHLFAGFSLQCALVDFEVLTVFFLCSILTHPVPRPKQVDWPNLSAAVCFKQRRGIVLEEVPTLGGMKVDKYLTD